MFDDAAQDVAFHGRAPSTKGPLVLRRTIIRARPRAVAKLPACATLRIGDRDDSAVIESKNHQGGHHTRHDFHRDPVYAAELPNTGGGR
ncbi:MAG: hypothetical protein ACREPZ_14115 [Rhodanobacteraceae bacterium]